MVHHSRSGHSARFIPIKLLAKVYLNPIDRAFADIDIDYIRYVDDMRIFCREIPASKKALMFLTQALRRRGLNLQSAKTQIVSAAHARRTIEGIAPIISEVVQRYRDSLRKWRLLIPIHRFRKLRRMSNPDDAPVEVVQEAFRLDFIVEPNISTKRFPLSPQPARCSTRWICPRLLFGSTHGKSARNRIVLQYVERVENRGGISDRTVFEFTRLHIRLSDLPNFHVA